MPFVRDYKLQTRRKHEVFTIGRWLVSRIPIEIIGVRYFLRQIFFPNVIETLALPVARITHDLKVKSVCQSVLDEVGIVSLRTEIKIFGSICELSDE